MNKMLVFFLLVSCAGKKAVPAATQTIYKPKHDLPLYDANKNAIKATRLTPGQKNPFAGDFKRENCQFGKVPVQDADMAAQYNFAPAAICSSGKAEYFSSFDQHWAHYEFVDAAAVAKTKLLFAVLDYGVEGGIETIPIFRSSDAGKSWLHIGNIHKPSFSARVESLSFSSAKIGKVVLNAGDNPAEKYIVDTKNGGKTWSAPYMSP